MKKILLSIWLMCMSVLAFAQWTLLTPAPTSNDLFSVYFQDVNTGYVVGESGTILKTTDGGTLWTPLNSGSSNNLNSVSFTDLNTGYVVGDSGTILKTINGGTTWVPQSSGTSVSLHSVYFPNNEIGYAVGDSMVFFTKDGGLTWKGKSLAGGEFWFHLNYVYFVNADTGFVTARRGAFMSPHGTVFKTTNGGLDWMICLPGWGVESGNLGSIFFTDVNTGYIAGCFDMTCNAYIVKTTDGGITWTNYSCGIYPDAIYFPSADTGYIIGCEGYNLYGVIRRTTDGGITWSDYLFWSAKYLNSVYFPAPQIGYVVGEDGTILKTTNGGGFVSIKKPISAESIFTLYPNPATNQITISTNRLLPGETNISIFSISGQHLMQARFQNQNQFDMNVSRLAKGIYQVKIQSNAGVENKKLVIK